MQNRRESSDSLLNMNRDALNMNRDAFSRSLSLSKRPMSPPGSFERLPLGYNCRVIPPSASGCRTRSGRNGGAR